MGWKGERGKGEYSVRGSGLGRRVAGCRGVCRSRLMSLDFISFVLLTGVWNGGVLLFIVKNMGTMAIVCWLC